MLYMRHIERIQWKCQTHNLFVVTHILRQNIENINDDLSMFLILNKH